MQKTMREMMDDMKEKEGVEFDRAFLDAMIIHHQQAIEMTNDARGKALNPRLKELAEEMNKRQQEEINEMEEMKNRL